MSHKKRDTISKGYNSTYSCLALYENVFTRLPNLFLPELDFLFNPEIMFFRLIVACEEGDGRRIDMCPYFFTIETLCADSCNLSEVPAAPAPVAGYARQFAQARCSSSSDDDDATKIGQLGREGGWYCGASRERERERKMRRSSLTARRSKRLGLA